jgi:hypothetical protein
MMKEVTENGLTMDEVIAKYYPEAVPKMKAMPEKKLAFYRALSEEASSNKGKVISIAAILIALGLLIPKAVKKEEPPQAPKVAGSEGAPAGTSIPAEEVPWKWVITGSNKPDALEKVPNATQAYEELKSNSVTKQENGKWSAGNRETPNTNGPTAQRLEELAKMSPEKRKEMVKAEGTVSEPAYMPVDLYSADDIARLSTDSPDGKAPVPNTEPPAEIAISSEEEKKKKKKKTPRITW